MGLINKINKFIGEARIALIQFSIWVGALFFLVYPYMSKQIGNGSAYWYISLLIVVFFCYIQYKSLYKILGKKVLGHVSEDNTLTSTKLQGIYFRIIEIITLLVLIGFAYYFYTDIQSTKNDENDIIGIISILLRILFIALIGLTAYFLLFSFFFLGILNNGIALALTLHNWLNGHGFKVEVSFFKFLSDIQYQGKPIDISISTITAIVINLSWIILSYKFTNSFNKETNIQKHTV